MTERSGDTISAVTEEQEPTPEQRRALFRVVRGTPSDAELAAVTVVLAAASSAGASDEPPPVRSLWSDPAAQHRVPLQPGPGAWRTTYAPR